MSDEKQPLWRVGAAALITCIVSGVASGAFLTRMITTADIEVRSHRAWKERSYSELLGPMTLQFARTKLAFDRWHEKNLYLEAQIIRTSNQTLRDLLLSKADLIPPDLMLDAAKLVEHYDVWLEEFDRLRGGERPDPAAPFTFAGPSGYPFPADAEAKFRTRHGDYWQLLYGDA